MRSRVRDMTRRKLFSFVVSFTVCGLPGFGVLPRCGAEEPGATAVKGFEVYVGGVEQRLERQHRSAEGFVAGLTAENAARLRRGELVVERLTPEKTPELPGAMLHHWRGTAFAAGARGEDFERLMRDFAGYPERFAPQVVRAKVVGGGGDNFEVSMRVRQKHVITVVMDTDYEVRFGRLDARDGYSASRSTRMAEIAGAGTAKERVLTGAEEHGFLWRLDTYWSWQERDGGLYMQIESVSLTRSIPTGLGWAIGPFVESVPRESLEFTLRATRDGVQKRRTREQGTREQGNVGTRERGTGD